MPSRNAFAIMPRCRLSALSTWHFLHRLRRLESALVARFPDSRWSMFAVFSVSVSPQRTHLNPSRSSTRRRVASHIHRKVFNCPPFVIE
jgi:hypothetical protein